MIQYVYTDNMTTQNITYGMIGRKNLVGKRDLSNHTVIIVADEIIDAGLIRETAEAVLTKGCKNVAFCGAAAEEWREIFDEKDREINGFNDYTGYEDFAVMWGIEDIDSLADEVSSCWNEVLILCDTMASLRNCREAIESGPWGRG